MSFGRTTLTQVKEGPLRHPGIHALVCRVSPVPAEEWLKVEACSQVVKVARRDYFLRAGETSDHGGLVVDGVLRVYRLGADGGEVVKAFRTQGEFVGAYAEALQGLPARNFVQALEDSEVLAFRLTDVRRLEAGHTCWTDLLRRVAEQHYVLKEQRESELLMLSAEERLDHFVRANPELDARLPRREVAAYLGITPEALSRIRSRRRRG